MAPADQAAPGAQQHGPVHHSGKGAGAAPAGPATASSSVLTPELRSELRQLIADALQSQPQAPSAVPGGGSQSSPPNNKYWNGWHEGYYARWRYVFETGVWEYMWLLPAPSVYQGGSTETWQT